MEYSSFGCTSTNSARGSKRKTTRSAAVIRIQKAARGFLARKNMRIVRNVSGELEEIARYIETTGEAIRLDQKERFRVGEMLMTLLFRLDSVRGVRDCRKKVTRRVIQLQESLESSPPELTPATRSSRVVEEKGGQQQGASVVAESQQVKGLLMELCERSAEQGQLMRRLVQSVEQLELAVQRIERKGKLQAREERSEEAVNCKPKDCSCQKTRVAPADRDGR